jgi:hypothetical protein
MQPGRGLVGSYWPQYDQDELNKKYILMYWSSLAIWDVASYADSFVFFPLLFILLKHEERVELVGTLYGILLREVSVYTKP